MIRVEGAISMAQFVSELKRQGMEFSVKFVATDIWEVTITGF